MFKRWRYLPGLSNVSASEKNTAPDNSTSIMVSDSREYEKKRTAIFIGMATAHGCEMKKKKKLHTYDEGMISDYESET